MKFEQAHAAAGKSDEAPGYIEATGGKRFTFDEQGELIENLGDLRPYDLFERDDWRVFDEHGRELNEHGEAMVVGYLYLEGPFSPFVAIETYFDFLEADGALAGRTRDDLETELETCQISPRFFTNGVYAH
ncbi:hypothetical protein [Tranquillimonas alkanivorans]|uniref:Uncharacterized protein n=1 Tax=Tranquillimonas alkanivorans TaxID=441119 RepID=A0A1I5TUE5_9RHOB|nr:hypothetical protein [Tranquillimonas alkanivorans]SFP86692.1 hypothetical protein SAMN04488047_11534 [Tranquillimonas alkanivorans]